MIKCTKCNGFLTHDILESDRTKLRIPAIKCFNCGKYWYNEADERELRGDYYVGSWKSRQYRYEKKD